MNRLFLSVSVALSATTCSFAQQITQPNLVLFIADDCSYYDLGCYGSVDSKTPNIDNFATQGVRFTQAYQAAPMSSPTRHNLYTGLWPVGSGAYPNHTCADQGTLSVVHHLHPLGYKVALIGKKHVAPKSVFPFDLYVPSEKGELHFEAIQKFIADCKRKGQPFCLFVASNQPHTPWNKGDVSQFDPDKLTLAPMYVDVPQTRQEFTKYLAEVNFMDQEFGNVLSILEQEKVADQSVVVYLSEQGNSLPFAKWTCYDAGVHSACIVRWPGVVKPADKYTVLVTGTVQEEDCDGLCWQYIINEDKVRPEFVVSTEPTDGGIYRGQRGRMEIRIDVKGVSCHGSAPERGDNAIYKMADILQDVRALNENDAADDKEVKGLVKMLDKKYNPEWEEANFLGRGTVTVSEIFFTSPSRCAVADSCAVSLDRRMTAGETWESCLDEIRALPAVKKYGDDVKVSMYEYNRPSYTDLVYPIECYFPTWVIPKDHDVTKALEEAYHNLYGEERIGAEETLAMRTARPLTDKWTFSTNGVSIMGRNGIPCIGFGPGAEAQAHAPNEKTWKQDLVTCAAVYAALPTVYCK